MKKFIKIFGLSLLLLALATMAVGQTVSGDLVGTVTDKSGAVVANAKVEISNIETGLKLTTIANNQGDYRFTNLAGGHYKVDAATAGMRGGYKDVVIQLNKTVTANIIASVSSEGEVVEVTAGAVQIDTTTQQIANTFEIKQNQDLPTATVGLGVLNLSLLNAGVASAGGIGVGTGPSVSGQRPRNNNFTVEGVDNNSKAVTGPVVTIPNDAVENFTILQNQFAPEFGHSSGGQFNQTIISGSNKWHGRAYEYFQNRNLNAIDAKDSRTQAGPHFTNPAYDNNRYGAQIGGAIIKDKLFFFTNHEYNPIHQNVGSAQGCAPTAAGYATAATTAGVSAVYLAALQKNLGTAATAAVGTDGLCSPSVTVGSSTIPTGELDFSAGAFNNTYTTANSIDLNISAKDQIRARYIYQKNNSTDTSANLPSFFTVVPARNQLLTISEFHTFGPTLTNELRFGFNRNTQTFTAGNFTFPGTGQIPNLTFDDLGTTQVGPDPNAPQFGVQNVYQLTNNISWVKGKHTLKFGVEGRKYISPQGFTQRVRGDYEYAHLQEFLFDRAPDPKTGAAERSTGNNTYYGDQSSIYAYGNDSFRITKNLTLNLGLRYEFTSVPSGERLQSLNSAASVPGLINFSSPQPQYKNFAPRVGFAYSPGASGNTSIRGGFGMAYDVLYDNLGLLTVPPQFGGTCNITAPNAACPFSATAFLATGGLPAGTGSGLQSFATVADQRLATTGYLPNQKLPYSENWNFGIQHVFASKYTVEVRYVGTRGIHLPVQQQLNVQPRISATQFLPTFFTQPDAATIAGLKTTLAQIQSNSNIIPVYAAAGLTNKITSYQPLGQSIYHGLQAQVQRNLTNNLQLQAAYTWSHAQDNSTADVFSTVLTPRRAQDSQDFHSEFSTSALDRRHRITLEAMYIVPFFKGSSNWLAKNLIGNWEIAPQWTFQSPEYFTAQSGVDSNLNGDGAPDRTILNPSGVRGTGSTTSPICNSSLPGTVACNFKANPITDVQDALPFIVGYVATNPNAQYVQANSGAVANVGRNTLPTPRTNNWDLTLVKRLNFTERTSFELGANAFNVFNHSQYIPGSVNTVNTFLTGTSNQITNYVQVKSNTFNNPKATFSNNSRTMQLVAKFIF